MSVQVQRALKTEELYHLVQNLVTEDTLDDVGGEGYLRGLLDAILSQGKIEGRLSAYASVIPHGDQPETDRLIEDWQRIVDGA